MAVKATLVFCAFALLVQHAVNACGGGCGCGCGCGCGGAGGRGASSSGGQFVVVSSSDAPTGIYVQSQNEYEGQLCIKGLLPFLGTTDLQGCLPTCGDGQVCYTCGGCDVSISEKSCGGGCGCGCGCGGGI